MSTTVTILEDKVLTVEVAGGFPLGNGVPSGGTTGQVLAKNSSTNYDVEWINVAGGGGAEDIEIAFDYGDASPKALGTVPANKVIYSVKVILTTPFNGTGYSLTVGDAADNDRLVEATDTAPGTAGSYETNPASKYVADTEVLLYITPGTSSQGSGVVVISYQS